MSAEWPRQCMSTHRTPVSATTRAMSGSARPPETSFTTLAPAAIAAAATAARVVSIETARPRSDKRRHHVDDTRAISVAGSTRSAPGRVDSPPTSMRSAPSAPICSPCATASSKSR